MNTHPCSVPGCGRLVSTEMLMCAIHWRRVPPRQRSAVWSAWRRYQWGYITLDQLRAVQQEATDAVVEGGVK